MHGDDVKGVLFDFNGTLARITATGASHGDVLTRLGLADLVAAWGDQWALMPGDGVAHRAHSGDEAAYVAWELSRLRAHARACGVPRGAIEELIAELHRADKALTMTCYDDALPALAALRERGLTIAVCSNWSWNLERVLAATGVADLVDVAVTSARVGARKPHPLIYRETLRRCGLLPEQAVFIGDMWGPDVLGPRAADIRAIHLWRPEERDGEGAPPPTPPGVARAGGLYDVVGLV
jgi:putative hydrolase of the HAD superfamily